MTAPIPGAWRDPNLTSDDLDWQIATGRLIPGTTTRTEAARQADTDTSAVDQAQRGGIAGIIAYLERIQQDAAEQGVTVHDLAEQGDPQWAGPSLPHPTEAGSEAEADELRQGWDDWQAGIDTNTAEEAQV